MASYWGITTKRFQDIANDNINIRFAYPSVQKGDVLILPRKINQSRDRFFFLQPFSKTVWVVTFAVLFFATFLRFGIEWFQNKFIRSKAKPENEMKYPVVISALFSWFDDPQDDNLRYFTSKLALFGLLIGMYVLHGLYLAAILEVLIREKSEFTEFHYTNYDAFMTNTENKLGCIYPTCDREPFPLPFHEELPGYSEKNDLAAIAKLKSGELDGIVHDYTYSLDFIKRDCEGVGYLPIGKNDWVDQHRAGIIRKTNLAWLTSKDFALQHHLDAAFKKLMNSGVMESLWEKYTSTCPPYKHEVNTSLIEFTDIEGVLVIVFAIIGFALLLTLLRFVMKFKKGKGAKKTGII